MHPSDFFENAPAVKGAHCFVVMPFKASFSDEVYVEIGSALKDLGITCHRADEDIHGGVVMTDVLRGLAEAELVIAELTGNNPNVLYELGIAHAVRCETSVLLITQDIEKVPFDLKHYRLLSYELGAPGFSELRKRLTEMVTNEILPWRFVYRWSEDKSGKTSEKYLGEDRKLYSFKICDVMSAQGAAEFRLVVVRHKAGLPDKEVYNKMQNARKPGETVQIPYLPSWAIKLDSATPYEAEFCACRPAP
jgi:hypothetical protein